MATVTINNAGENLRIVLNHSPKDYDIAIASVDSYGNSGSLNEYVLNEYGYVPSDLKELDLKGGFDWLQKKNRKPILFIVTIGDYSTTYHLQRNLFEGLMQYSKLFNTKKIWIPLLGTGSGKLKFVTSYNTILNVVSKFPDYDFSISIPNDDRGLDFIKQYNIPIENPDEKLKNSKPNDKTKYFVAGHIWGKNDDQMTRFLQNSIWENGHEAQDGDIVNSATPGDVIFLKSTFAKDNISYLRIKAIGQVTENKYNGRELSIIWNPLANYLDIEGLGKYRRTIARVKENDIQKIQKVLLQNSPRATRGIFFPALNWPSESKSENENPIDFEGSLFYGRHVGEEIKDYDVIILPKSSFGGVGNNSISTHILELLDIDKDSLNFSKENLIKYKYANFEFYNRDDRQNINKTFVLIFVVTRNESKNYIQFDKQLVNAIENFRKSQIAFNFIEGRKHLKIFIPFLGAGQAGMPIEESFKYLLPGLRQLRVIDTPKSIRINYPRELDNESIASFNKQLLDEFNLEPSEQTNLSQDPGLETEINNQDKIPFHLDQVVDEDKLGREPVAKAFVDLVKKDIFTDKLNYSFMVHLQGEWGSGKSSFLNFIKKHLNSNNDNWIVVDYNAWQNQHIDPPWWTLIDHIYRNSRKQLGLRPKVKLWFKESFRRIWRYTGWEKIVAFFVFSLCTACILFFGEDILKFLSEIASKSESSDKKEDSLLKTLSDFGKLIVTGTSLVGLLYTLSKFITVPFFINSSKEAKSFVLRAADPMNKVKSHFNDLVDDINSKKKNRQLAIFIDDIDRCDKEFIVCLLEGIQTLFKEKKVLYVIAGDKNWITQSFGKVYKDFVSNNTNENQLGEFFLEKAFQLSFRLPKISEEAKQNYWQSLLGVSPEAAKKTKRIEELTPTEQVEVKQRIATSTEEITKPAFMKEIEEEYNLTQDDISNLVIEEKNKDQTEIKHLLTDFHTFIDSNPRSIIRLANNYTMTRSTLIAERREFTERNLFRWLAIEDLYSEITNFVKSGKNITTIQEKLEKIPDLTIRENCLKLFFGNKTEEDKMTLEEIKRIKGI